MNDAVVRAFIVAVVSACFRPRPRELAWEWAERLGVVLDTKESKSFPGPYSSALTPYTRLVHEFYASRQWDELIIKKSSQSGFTLAILILFLFVIAECPTDILYVIDTREEARKISKTRLQPAIRRLLRKIKNTALFEPIEDDDGISNLTLFLSMLTIYMLGSFSSGSLANKSVGLAVLDELDEHPPAPDDGSTTIDLARDRVKSVRGRGGGKLIAFSKPKLESGLTCTEHKTGSCHVIEIPCPHCGEYQALEWERVKFSHCKDMVGAWDLNRVLTETFYECRQGCRIEEFERLPAIQKYRARSTNSNHKPRKMSLEISDLYSPFCTFGELAVEWIEAQGNIVKLQAFTNGRLGQGFKPKEAEVKESEVRRLCAAYKRGTIPVMPCLVDVTADKQGDVHKWTKAGFLPDGTLYLIDYGYTLDPDELLTVAAEPVEVVETGENVVASMGLIDEGFKTTDVRDFCDRAGGLFYPSKGRGGIQVRNIVYESTALHRGQEVVVYHYDDDNIKKEFYLNRIKNAFQQIDKDRPLKHPAPRLYLPVDIGPDFIAELTAEKFVEQKGPHGFTRWIWEKDKSKANDFGDAMKMHMVLWHVVAEHFQPPAPPAKEEVLTAQAACAA